MENHLKEAFAGSSYCTYNTSDQSIEKAPVLLEFPEHPGRMAVLVPIHP